MFAKKLGNPKGFAILNNKGSKKSSDPSSENQRTRQKTYFRGLQVEDFWAKCESSVISSVLGHIPVNSQKIIKGNPVIIKGQVL